MRWTHDDMLKALTDFLFPTIPASFVSDFSTVDSVTRLREATRRSVFSSLAREFAAGTVSESRVRLQRVKPFFGNSFKPILFAAFHRRGVQTVLEGRFTIDRVTIVWLAFALLWTVLAISVTVAFEEWINNPAVLLFPLFGVGLTCVGIGIVRFGWWISRRDIQFLEDVVTRALSASASNKPLQPTSGARRPS